MARIDSPSWSWWGLTVLLGLVVSGVTWSCIATETLTVDVTTGDTASDTPPDRVDEAEDALQTTDPGTDPGVDADRDVSRDAPADAPADGHADTPPIRPEGSGTWDDPFNIWDLPYAQDSDTGISGVAEVERYGCAPEIREDGPEVVYRVTAPRDGILAVAVDDSAPGVDVDVHLLEVDRETCRVRHNTHFWEVVFEGDELLVVVDTWTDAAGTQYAGPYRLTVDLQPLPGGLCTLERGAIALFNRPEPLMLPAVGAVVREAHLVTPEEFPGAWPTSSRDGIEAHYDRTQTASGYVMDRREPWAPEGEGGSEWGQGSTSRPPPLEETWYVNMYWRDRPAQGTRMLVYNPANGRAVVGAGGYETGPGSAARLGGATEEIHHYLGSTHGTRLLMAFMIDQEVTFGPVDCD